MKDELSVDYFIMTKTCTELTLCSTLHLIVTATQHFHVSAAYVYALMAMLAAHLTWKYLKITSWWSKSRGCGLNKSWWESSFSGVCNVFRASGSLSGLILKKWKHFLSIYQVKFIVDTSMPNSKDDFQIFVLLFVKNALNAYKQIILTVSLSNLEIQWNNLMSTYGRL